MEANVLVYRIDYYNSYFRFSGLLKNLQFGLYLETVCINASMPLHSHYLGAKVSDSSTAEKNINTPFNVITFYCLPGSSSKR